MLYASLTQKTLFLYFQVLSFGTGDLVCDNLCKIQQVGAHLVLVDEDGMVLHCSLQVNMIPWWQGLELNEQWGCIIKLVIGPVLTTP